MESLVLVVDVIVVVVVVVITVAMVQMGGRRSKRGKRIDSRSASHGHSTKKRMGLVVVVGGGIGVRGNSIVARTTGVGLIVGEGQ